MIGRPLRMTWLNVVGTFVLGVALKATPND